MICDSGKDNLVKFIIFNEVRLGDASEDKHSMWLSDDEVKLEFPQIFPEETYLGSEMFTI